MMHSYAYIGKKKKKTFPRTPIDKDLHSQISTLVYRLCKIARAHYIFLRGLNMMHSYVYITKMNWIVRSCIMCRIQLKFLGT